MLKAAGGTMISGSIVYLEDHFGRHLATQDQRLVGVSPIDCLNAAYGCQFLIDIRSTGNLPPARSASSAAAALAGAVSG